MKPIQVNSQLGKLALVLSISIGLMALASSTEVQYTAYGQVMPDVTPRGTSPLPPTGPTPAPTSPGGTPQAAISPTVVGQAPTQVPASTNSGPSATERANPPDNSGGPPLNDNTSGTAPTLVRVVPSGFEPPSPLRTVDTVPSNESAFASITIGESNVTVSRPEKANDPGARVSLEIAGLSGDARGVDAELLTTNIAFSLRSEDKASDPVRISVDYSDSQTSGIKEESLSLYSYQNSTWTRVDSCVTNDKANNLSCSSAPAGTFMVAGRTPSNSAVSDGSRSGADTISVPLVIGALGLVALLFAAGVFFSRRGFLKKT